MSTWIRRRSPSARARPPAHVRSQNLPPRRRDAAGPPVASIDGAAGALVRIQATKPGQREGRDSPLSASRTDARSVEPGVLQGLRGDEEDATDHPSSLTWFFVCVLFAVGLNGLYGVRTELARYELDLGERHVVMGRVLRQRSRRSWRRRERHMPSRSSFLTMDRRFRRVDIRWMYLDHAMHHRARRPHRGASEALAPLRSDPKSARAPERKPLYVCADAAPGTARERAPGVHREAGWGERGRSERALRATSDCRRDCAPGSGSSRRSAGPLVVARPIRRLVEHARRIGRGTCRPHRIEAGRDEIARLGREMNADVRKLAEAQTRSSSSRAAPPRRRLSTVRVSRPASRTSWARPQRDPLRAKAIARGRSTGSQTQEATSIEQQASRVTQLVRQLLDFARRRRQIARS